MVLSKTGESSLVARINFIKVYKGDTGGTGETGTTGAQGIQGPTGLTGPAGTGVAIIKKTITPDTGGPTTKSDYGDGTLKLTFGSAHGLEANDWIRIYQALTYNAFVQVHTVISTTEIKIDVAYDSTAGSVTVFDLEKFQFIADSDPQFLVFKDIIPINS